MGERGRFWEFGGLKSAAEYGIICGVFLRSGGKIKGKTNEKDIVDVGGDLRVAGCGGG